MLADFEFAVSCFPVRHRDTDSFGCTFESQARRHLQPDRLAALGVPGGPERQGVGGRKVGHTRDDRTIDPEEVLGPPERRKKLVIVGDAETTDGLTEHVRDTDVLMIETTFLDRDAAIARDYGCLTSAEAAALAATSNVKLLVLTPHISGRCTDEEIFAEATRAFANGRIAPDLNHISI